MNGKRGDKREGGRKVASYGPQFDFMAHAHSNVSHNPFLSLIIWISHFLQNSYYFVLLVRQSSIIHESSAMGFRINKIQKRRAFLK